MKNNTLRTRLAFTFSSTVAGIALICSYIIIVVSLIVISVTNSYQSNEFLNDYISTLLSMEKSLSTYMDVRSFESIDEYYTYRSELEDLTLLLYQRPSNQEELLLEYKIMRMAHSFVAYSDRALASRRANRFIQADEQYSLAQKTYQHLFNSLSQLNQLYFSKNHETYNLKRLLFRRIRLSGLFLLVSVITLSILHLILRTSEITKPLEEVSEIANDIANHNFDVPPFKENASDEINAIYKAFNKMSASIKEYISKIILNAKKQREMQEKENYMQNLYKEAQLKALRSQIDPHFLFNTLNAGAGLAILEGADKTNLFIEKTADFFRYNLQHQNIDSSIEEEITLVDNYVYIMNVRFANKFAFEKKIESTHLHLRLPCMTLQPLIENCIKHGSVKGKKSKITLQVKDSDCFVFITIKDNGKGMSLETKNRIMENQSKKKSPSSPQEMSRYTPGAQEASQIISSQFAARSNTYNTPHESTENKINKSQSEGTGIGLLNVIERLKIAYPNVENIFSILDNNEEGGSGTIFAIRIPYV